MTSLKDCVAGREWPEEASDRWSQLADHGILIELFIALELHWSQRTVHVEGNVHNVAEHIYCNAKGFVSTYNFPHTVF